MGSKGPHKEPLKAQASQCHFGPQGPGAGPGSSSAQASWQEPHGEGKLSKGSKESSHSCWKMGLDWQRLSCCPIPLLVLKSQRNSCSHRTSWKPQSAPPTSWCPQSSVHTTKTVSSYAYSLSSGVNLQPGVSIAGRTTPIQKQRESPCPSKVTASPTGQSRAQGCPEGGEQFTNGLPNLLSKPSTVTLSLCHRGL